MLQETKIDESFPNAQFGVPGVQLYRNDNTGKSGGLMLYVKTDFPKRRRDNIEVNELVSRRFEPLVIEMAIRKEKWIVCSVYKSLSMRHVTCFDTGLGDFHCMVCFATKIVVPRPQKRNKLCTEVIKGLMRKILKGI